MKFKRIVSLLLCLALAFSLCACGGETETKTNNVTDDESQHVELTWLISNSQPVGFEEVLAAANEHLKEKLNVTLDLQCIEPGDYEQKVQLALASGSDIDIIWTSDWLNDYPANCSKGAFLALDEYLELPELADLKNYYSDGIWDACRIGGKVYGVPVEQVFHVQRGYQFHKEISNKYNLEEKIRGLAWVDENNHGTMDDLDEIFDIVRAGEPMDSLFIVEKGFETFIPEYSKVQGYDIIDGVVTEYSDEANLANFKRYREWNEKGYFPADIATNDNIGALAKAGQIYTRYNRYLPGVEAKHALSNDYEVIVIPTSEMVITRTGIQSTLNAIASSSKNPIRALKLMYLMHTDEYLMNLLSYGIEGRDYTKDPENPKRMNRDSSGYYIPEFMIGSQFLCYLAPSYEDGVWEQTKHENEIAKIDEYIGFSFDASDVESEISQVAAVRGEYSKILACGLSADYESLYYEQKKKLQLAGEQTIQDEIQRQLDQWLETQK